MPGHIDQSIRHRLDAAGLWGAFRQRRDQLRDGGMPAELANRQAVRELLPAEGEPLPPMPVELANRVAAEPETIRWVARNLDSPAPDAATCPDGAAWALLRQCRQDPLMRQHFVGDLWAKLMPPAGQPEQEPIGVPVVARPTPSVLARLRAIAEACLAGR